MFIIEGFHCRERKGEGVGVKRGGVGGGGCGCEGEEVWEDVGVRRGKVWEKGGDGGGWSMSVEDLLLEEHGEHHLIGLLGETGEEEDLVGCLLARGRATRD